MVWLIGMSLGCALTPTGPGGAHHRQGKAGAASSVLYRTNLLPEWPVNCGCGRGCGGCALCSALAVMPPPCPLFACLLLVLVPCACLVLRLVY